MNPQCQLDCLPKNVLTWINTNSAQRSCDTNTCAVNPLIVLGSNVFTPTTKIKR